MSPTTRQRIDDEAKKAKIKEYAKLKGPYPYLANFEPRTTTAVFLPFKRDPFDAFEISDLNDLDDFDFDCSEWVIDEAV